MSKDEQIREARKLYDARKLKRPKQVWKFHSTVVDGVSRQWWTSRKEV